VVRTRKTVKIIASDFVEKFREDGFVRWCNSAML
jgi:hypothetical protein